MDNAKSSPFRPATDVPLHRVPPLAPSQELAYRNKCIQLKRRLTEIETNNDATRRRISTGKERVQKMRLLRSILLHQVKEIMETPGKKMSPEQLQKLGIVPNGSADDDIAINSGARPEGEMLLDDSSSESDEDVPEPSDRPTRARRQNNNYRESITSSAAQSSANPSAFQHQGLPTIAPASSFSPATQREPALANSFSTPIAAGSPHYNVQQPQSYVQDHRYAQSSPVQHAQPTQVSPGKHNHHEQNGFSRSQTLLPEPIRPAPPYEQFYAHMVPQLEADNYPQRHIKARIDEEWAKLSRENRGLWEERYHEQMADYEREKDEWKRQRRATDSRGTFSSANR